jgi:hypothetical protein
VHMRSAGFAAMALFSLLILAKPATGATVTCAQTILIDDGDWGDNLLKRLYDEGFPPSKQSSCAAVMLSGEIVTDDAKKLETLVQDNIPFIFALALIRV